MAYSPEVEQWRPLIEKYFQPQDVDKALYVISHESGGNASIYGDGGHAVGLFQHNDGGLASGRDLRALENPEANIKLAAAAVYGGREGFSSPQGWGPWGEGRTYEGKPFGALGNNPYNGGSGNTSNTGNTRILVSDSQDVQTPFKVPEGGSPYTRGTLGEKFGVPASSLIKGRNRRTSPIDSSPNLFKIAMKEVQKL